MIQVAYVIVWWLVLMVIGLISFPLVSRVCGKLPDKGYSISKLVGLLFLTYITWMLSSLHVMPFGYVSIWISLLLLAALSLYLGRKNLRLAEWPRKQIIISESIFTVAFVLFIVIMVLRPDIYFNNVDHFLDFAFMGTIIRGDYFPPVDPWLAGESIPYYYGGHLLSAILTVFTRVPPSIAFNIAVAMFFALAVNASYGLGYNITKRKLYGFLAVIFICVAGYISGAYQLIAYVFQTDIMGYYPHGAPNIIEWLLSFNFGGAPWLIPQGMVQYPSYIHLMGTLHAFMMGIPFQLMFIMLVFALFKKWQLSDKIARSDTLLDVFILGLCLGFFYFINAWEYPTYIIFTVLAFILLRMRRGIKDTLTILGGIIGLSLLLYIPLYLSTGTGGIHGIGLVAKRTGLTDFLEFGVLFLFAVCSLLVILVLSKREIFRGKVVILAAVLILLATILSVVLLDFPLLLVVVPMGLLSLYYIYRSKQKAEMEFVLLLVLMGALLAFFCDFLYLDDSMPDDWERFNTVFKLYLQIWVFLGIAAACAVFYVLKHLKGKAKAIWVIILGALIVASLIHPLASTISLSSGRHESWGMNRGTLDGMAYVEMVDKGDYEAIKWINDNIGGNPVILETPGGFYDYTSRISAFTGLPTLLGWEVHEIQFGRTWKETGDRRVDADTTYNTSDNDLALVLLAKYNVEYVYIGTLERERYASEGLQKFANHPEDYESIYESEGVTIYKVREE